MDEVTTAVVVGVTLGLFYGVSSYLTFLWAMKRPGVQFIVIAFGGILVRMALAFVAVVVITHFYNVEQTPFFLGFVTTFIIVLTFEIGAMHKGLHTDLHNNSGASTNEKASNEVNS